MAKRITISYLIIGCLWIFFSDMLMDWFIVKEHLTANQTITISLFKGTGYVLITGLALYAFTRRSFNKLQGLEKQYRRLFEDNPNPMWVYDTETLQFLAVNKAAQASYGYTEQEFTNLTLRDISPPEDIAELNRTLAKHTSSYSNNGVYRHLKKNGEIIYVNIYSSATVFKNIEAQLVLALDVSEKRLAEYKIIELNKDLQAFKTRLNTILSNVNDVVWSCTPTDYKVTYISGACYNVYGYTDQEFYANNNLWINIIHPEDIDKIQKSFEVLSKNGSNEQEYRVISKSGTVKVMYDKSFLTYDDEGKPKEIQGVAADITRLRESQQKLVAYSQRIAAVLDGITDGFITLDTECRLTYVNKVFQDITSLDRDSLLNKEIWEVFDGLKNTPFYNHLLYVLKNDISYSFEANYIVPGRWYGCRIYPNTGGVSIFFADITEMQTMNEEIKKTKNNLNSLINTTSDLIWSIDTNKNLITFNKAFSNYTNLIIKETQQEGESALPKSLPEDVYAMWENYYNMGLKGELEAVEFVFPLKDPEKESPCLEIRFNPILSPQGEIVGLSCYGRDITERKKYEMHIKQQNKKLMEISWMQSHEVRGPLSTIMALSAHIKQSDMTDAENLNLLSLLDAATAKLDTVIQKIVTKSNEARAQNSEMHETSLTSS